MSEPKAYRERIGDMLVSAGLLGPAQLEEALAAQRGSGVRLGKLLVNHGFVTELQLAQTLSNQLSIPWVSLERIEFSRDLLALVPGEFAERYILMPVYVRSVRGQGRTLYVAMEDPTDEPALQALARVAGMPVRAMIAAPGDIRRAIDRHYFAENAGPATAPTAGLQEALERAVEAIHANTVVAPSPEPRAPVKVPPAPPPPPAAKPAVAPQRVPGLVPLDEYDTPSQPPPSAARTLTFLDGTQLSLPPAGTRFSQEVTEVRHVVRAIRAANADSGVDEPPTWHAVVKVVIEAAAARGVSLTRKEISEAWLRMHERGLSE